MACVGVVGVSAVMICISGMMFVVCTSSGDDICFWCDVLLVVVYQWKSQIVDKIDH